MDDFQVLETVRNEIHAEHTLISHRITWYVTSQSFLVAAYALSWTKEYGWPKFFHYAIPILGLLLSALAFFAIACAIVVQWDDIKTQEKILAEMKERFQHREDSEEARRVNDYEQITGKGRKTGPLTHWLAMIPPLFIPIIFATTWIVALSVNGK